MIAIVARRAAIGRVFPFAANLALGIWIRLSAVESGMQAVIAHIKQVWLDVRMPQTIMTPPRVWVGVYKACGFLCSNRCKKTWNETGTNWMAYHRKVWVRLHAKIFGRILILKKKVSGLWCTWQDRERRCHWHLLGWLPVQRWGPCRGYAWDSWTGGIL